MRKVASIFGGGSPKKTQEYFDTVEIASLLARYEYDIKTGGYGGIMEAANKGAQEGGAESYGITCEIFSTTKSNEYTTQTIVTETMFQRLEILMDSDLYVFQKGGIGTFSEFFLLLDLVRKQEHKPPIFILHSFWLDIIDIMKDNNLTHDTEVPLIPIFDIEELEHHLKSLGKKG